MKQEKKKEWLALVIIQNEYGVSTSTEVEILE
jgi:hypothetical protein